MGNWWWQLWHTECRRWCYCLTCPTCVDNKLGSHVCLQIVAKHVLYPLYWYFCCLLVSSLFPFKTNKNGITCNLQLYFAVFQANMDSNPGDAWGNGYWMDWIFLIFLFFPFSFFNSGLLNFLPNSSSLKKGFEIDLGFTSVNITKTILFLNSHISHSQWPGEVLPPLVFISLSSVYAQCWQKAFVTWRKEKLPMNAQCLYSTARGEPKILTQIWMSLKSQCLYVDGVFPPAKNPKHSWQIQVQYRVRLEESKGN